MKVDIFLFSDARRVVGEKQVQLDLAAGSTVEEALEALFDIYGIGLREAIVDEKNNHYKMIFSINKKMVQADQVLSDGDVLTIFPTAGGG